MGHPNKYESIIMDSMDQKKTKQKKKDLTQRIIGVKVHELKNYVFVVDETVPGGSNLMINILHRVLMDLEAKSKLPTNFKSTMFLQVDNSVCGENKKSFDWISHTAGLGESFSQSTSKSWLSDGWSYARRY